MNWWWFTFKNIFIDRKMVVLQSKVSTFDSRTAKVNGNCLKLFLNAIKARIYPSTVVEHPPDLAPPFGTLSAKSSYIAPLCHDFQIKQK